MKKRTFSHSFRPRVRNLKPDDTCELKKHYTGAMREVLGLLDRWASNDPERFIPNSVDEIVKWCHRYKGAAYKKRQVEYILAEFRARHIISKRLTRKRDGVEVSGFIVAPHESLAIRESETCCVFLGELKGARGVWKRTPAEPFRNGVVYWAGFPEPPKPFEGSLRTASDPSRNAGCAVESADACADNSADNSADGCAVAISAQEDESRTVYTENAPYRVPEVPLFTVDAEKTAIKNPSVLVSDQEREEEKRRASEEVLSSEGVNKETIGQHFGDDPDFEIITDGELNTTTDQWSDFDGSAVLQRCCADAVKDFADQPYDGRATNMRLMDASMKRFGDRVPPAWLKVIYTLRDTPGPAKVKSNAQQMWESFGVVPDGNGGWKKATAAGK